VKPEAATAVMFQDQSDIKPLKPPKSC